MVDNAIILALIVAIPAVASPLLMAWLTNRNISKGKEQDYARQDAVAAQAVIAAQLLEDRQNSVAAKAAEAARLLLAANERVAATAKVTIQKLDVIHTLVNSNMTAAMQSQFDALSGQLVLMHEVVDLKRTAGRDPSAEAMQAISIMETRIAELGTAITDRKS